jgi:putative hydrolase of the HAD superfamily
MPQLIVFDFGGTLDTHGRHWSHLLYEGWKRRLPKLSWDVFWEAYVQAERSLQTQPDWDFLRTLQEKCLLEAQFIGGNISRTAALDVAQRCHSEVELCISLSRGVLERLRRQTPLVLVSNFYGNLSAVLSAFSLSGCFEHVIESARVGIRKPDPAIYAKVLELYPSIPPEDILVVGDSEKNDMLPAVSLGMKAHLVRNFDDLLALV